MSTSATRHATVPYVYTDCELTVLVIVQCNFSDNSRQCYFLSETVPRANHQRLVQESGVSERVRGDRT